MKRIIGHLKIAVFVIALSFVANYFRKQSTQFFTTSPPKLQQLQTATTQNFQHYYQVTYVIDGDTIELNNGKRVRLLLVWAPEWTTKKEPGGKEATEFLKKLLPLGTWVELEFDKRVNDKWGRLLAHVYIKSDDPDLNDTWVNAEVVYAGWGYVKAIPPNTKYMNYLKQYEYEAKKNKRGIWGIPYWINRLSGEEFE